MKKGRKGGAPRLDAMHLAGITSLMNPQHIKAGVNLEESEKTIMNKAIGAAGGAPARKEFDPVTVYQAELNSLAEELGIDLHDDSAPPPKIGGKPPSGGKPALGKLQVAPRPSLALVDELDLGSVAPSRRSKKAPTASTASTASETTEYETTEYETTEYETTEYETDSGEYETDSDEYETESGASSADNDKVGEIIAGLETELGIRTDGKHERRRARLKVVDVPQAERRGRRDQVTDEQERRRHINSIVADVRGETRTTFGVEHERLQDLKANKLEQIGQLILALTEEGIDCSSVTRPTSESSVEEIDSVLNILRLKNDRNRYSSIAEEVILGVAEGIETVFNGEREIPLLGWRPDYTGYHNTCNVKMHRMRFETSQIVGGIIEKYNIGPTARIIMELLPSFFLYPRQQKKQRGAPSLASDLRSTDLRSSFAAIRNSDDRKTLDDVRQI